MTEATPEVPPTEAPTTETEIVVNPTRLQAFVINHPRAARVVAIVGALLSFVGVAHVSRTVHARQQHVKAAGEHSRQALAELSTAVSPEVPENQNQN